jgi:hypothetical protein
VTALVITYADWLLFLAFLLIGAVASLSIALRDADALYLSGKRIVGRRS